jgi:hypothetical protein
MILPDDDSPHPGKDRDVRMLSLFPGKERSLAGYSALLAGAGLRLDAITKLAGGTSLIEASPVRA